MTDYDASDLVKYFQKVISGFDHSIENSLDLLADIGKNKAKTSTLFKGGTGPTSLRSNIKITKDSRFSRTIFADRNYAFYVEEGNNQQGDYIYPKYAKALHFFVNGTEVFAKKVKAHGPIPFMKTASEETAQQAHKIVEQEITRLINRS